MSQKNAKSEACTTRNTQDTIYVHPDGVLEATMRSLLYRAGVLSVSVFHDDSEGVQAHFVRRGVSAGRSFARRPIKPEEPLSISISNQRIEEPFAAATQSIQFIPRN